MRYITLIIALMIPTTAFGVGDLTKGEEDVIKESAVKVSTPTFSTYSFGEQYDSEDIIDGSNIVAVEGYNWKGKKGFRLLVYFQKGATTYIYHRSSENPLPSWPGDGEYEEYTESP